MPTDCRVAMRPIMQTSGVSILNIAMAAIFFAFDSISPACSSDLASSCDSYSECRKTELDIDYMFWWTNGTVVPPLVSTSPQGVAQNQAGVLPNAALLFGSGPINDGLRGGGRVQWLQWLDHDCQFGLDLTYLGADPPSNENFSSNSDIHPILARPFLNVTSGIEDAELVSFPGQLRGAIDINVASEFHSLSTLMRINVGRSCSNALDIVAGYRFFRFSEGISISERIVSVNPVGIVGVGTTFDVMDTFSAVSNFNGAELGIVNTKSLGFITLSSSAKVAAGGVRKRLAINGQTNVTVPAAGSSNTPAGFYALPSNIGTTHEDDFAFLPELGVKSKLQLNQRLNFSVSYTALCLTNVLRVGNAIDRNLDLQQLPPAIAPATRPTSQIGDSGLFAQSLGIGIEWLR